LWVAEHHFQHEGSEVIPNLLMVAVHLVHLTKTLKIGCGFNFAPMWRPLRLAEDYAVADILTKGRTVFGVGRGYQTREVETFGAPMINQDANRELFEGQVNIIFKAFNNESFAHKGKYSTLPPKVPYRGYQLKELTLVPRPITAYRDAAVRAGQDLKLGQNLMLGIFFHLAGSKEKALAALRPLYEEHAKMFAPLGFLPGATPAQVEAISKRGGWYEAGVPRLEGLNENRSLVRRAARGPGGLLEGTGGAVSGDGGHQSQHADGRARSGDAGPVQMGLGSGAAGVQAGVNRRRGWSSHVRPKTAPSAAFAAETANASESNSSPSRSLCSRWAGSDRMPSSSA
jgi:alkanesulfonate monooxygenase SsuD/methylene tetrahydromethanopterin reductase-like flavin-dependent oxidoreductase (luciferase family)